ncbi:MAG: RNase H family protein [Acidimicrobiales bacterium]
MKRGWRNAKGDTVANRDLWEPLLQLVLDGPIEVDFSWTRGHSGDTMNELVDAMANEAARTQRGRGPA